MEKKKSNERLRRKSLLYWCFFYFLLLLLFYCVRSTFSFIVVRNVRFFFLYIWSSCYQTCVKINYSKVKADWFDFISIFCVRFYVKVGYAKYSYNNKHWISFPGQLGHISMKTWYTNDIKGYCIISPPIWILSRRWVGINVLRLWHHF